MTHKQPEILKEILNSILADRPEPKSKDAKQRSKVAKQLASEVTKEIADAHEEVERDKKEVGKYVREREASIRKGARRAGKRFSL